MQVRAVFPMVACRSCVSLVEVEQTPVGMVGRVKKVCSKMSSISQHLAHFIERLFCLILQRPPNIAGTKRGMFFGSRYEMRRLPIPKSASVFVGLKDA